MGKIFRLSSSKPIIVLILLGTLILPNLSPGLAAPALAQVSNKHIIFSLADLERIRSRCEKYMTSAR
jgi:hypothetical protein